jgi:hypothetical protein
MLKDNTAFWATRSKKLSHKLIYIAKNYKQPKLLLKLLLDILIATFYMGTGLLLKDLIHV